MTIKNKRIERKARYTTWKESGKSIAEWCRNEEITLHQMYYWVRQFEEESVLSIAEGLSQLCGLLSHHLRMIEPVNAEARASEV